MNLYGNYSRDPYDVHLCERFFAYRLVLQLITYKQ